MNELSFNPASNDSDIEPIDYIKIKNNPPLWVINEQKNAALSSSHETREELNEAVERVSLYALAGLIFLSGAALFGTGLFMPISAFFMTMICGVGLIFASSGAIAFAAAYKAEKLERE
ncbi:MAG: hypothetical protein ACK4HV_04470 [Parachlamydiaceae bacterium]